MELGHMLTRSGLTHPEVFSKVYHDSFCQLGSSISFRWVIYFEAFYLHGEKLDRFSLNDNMDLEKVSRFKYAT
jgi:hypothetical protein